MGAIAGLRCLSSLSGQRYPTPECHNKSSCNDRSGQPQQGLRVGSPLENPLGTWVAGALYLSVGEDSD